MIFSFGESEHERIEVDVLGYERRAVCEYHDDNWLKVQIRVGVGGLPRYRRCRRFSQTNWRPFSASCVRSSRAFGARRGFTTLEGQLHLRLAGDGKGHVELVGDVADQPGIGNRLHFTLEFDQSQLGAAIRGIP